MDEWQTQVPADCIFLDQLGARPVASRLQPGVADPDSPTTTAGSPCSRTYADRCLMVEDGWDRLARDVGRLPRQPADDVARARPAEHATSARETGSRTRSPSWLFHDKVLMYQHDLYDGTMAIDLEVLTWNMAFGLVSSYSWDELGPGGEPVARARRAPAARLRPALRRRPALRLHEPRAGREREHVRRPRGRREPGRERGYSVDGYDVAPGGFFARTAANDLLAGAFAGLLRRRRLSAGVHYLIVERDRGERDRTASRSAPTRRRGRAASRRAARSRRRRSRADGTALGTVAGACRTGISSSVRGTLNGGRSRRTA